MKPQKMLLSVIVSTLFAVASFGASQAAGMNPDDALKLLKEGNARFAAGKSENPHIGSERLAQTASQGQHPFAIVLSCSDSRVPVEPIFDRGIGDIFVIRVAGNVCSTDEAASIEYAIEHLGSRLLVIMGHSQCGAVKAAIGGGKAGGNVDKLLVHIRPAAQRACGNSPDAEKCLNAAIKENVWQSISDMLSISSIIRDAAANKNVVIVGAVYDISTGKVEWLGQHPGENTLLKSSASERTERPFKSLQCASLQWVQVQTIQ